MITFDAQRVAQSLPESVRAAILQAEAIGDSEGAIETVFSYLPTCTRDEAVDLYEVIVKSGSCDCMDCSLNGEPTH